MLKAAAVVALLWAAPCEAQNSQGGTRIIALPGGTPSGSSSIISGTTPCTGCASGGVAYNGSGGKVTTDNLFTYAGSGGALLYNGNQVATTNQLASLNPLTLPDNGIGAVSTDVLLLENLTAAGAGAQQWSPRMHLIGQGWKTASTAGSETVDGIIELQTKQGSSTPTGAIVLSTQINGSGYIVGASFGGIAAGGLIAGGLELSTDGTTFDFGLGWAARGVFGVRSDGQIGFTNGGTGITALDGALCRASSGVLEIATGGSCNSLGSLLVASVQPGIRYSAAGTPLPACNSGLDGVGAVVSDSTGPTYRNSYLSGGTVTVHVFCVNGSGWLND